MMDRLTEWEDRLRREHPWWYLGLEALVLVLGVGAVYVGLLFAAAYDPMQGRM